MIELCYNIFWPIYQELSHKYLLLVIEKTREIEKKQANLFKNHFINEKSFKKVFKSFQNYQKLIERYKKFILLAICKWGNILLSPVTFLPKICLHIEDRYWSPIEDGHFPHDQNHRCM